MAGHRVGIGEVEGSDLATGLIHHFDAQVFGGGMVERQVAHCLHLAQLTDAVAVGVGKDASHVAQHRTLGEHEEAAHGHHETGGAQPPDGHHQPYVDGYKQGQQHEQFGERNHLEHVEGHRQGHGDEGHDIAVDPVHHPAPPVAPLTEMVEQGCHAEGAGRHHGQQVAHLLLGHERQQHHGRHHPCHGEEVGTRVGDALLPVGHEEGGEGEHRPHAGLGEEAPVVVPCPGVVVGPRPRLLGHHGIDGVAVEEVEPDVPPAAHHHGDHHHEGYGIPLAAGSGAGVTGHTHEEGQQQGIERHGALAQKRQAHQHPGRAHPPPAVAATGGEAPVEHIDATHHQRMAVDIPGGRAAHEHNLVAGEEYHRGDERIASAPRQVQGKEIHEERPHAAHHAGRHALGREAARPSPLDGPGHPRGQRRLLQTQLAVHGRHDDVALGGHLMGSDEVAHLHDVGGQGGIVDKERRQGQHDDKDITLSYCFHDQDNMFNNL